MRSGRGSEASQVGSHTAAKSPKNTGSGANQSPNKMNLASLGFHLWFHCFYVPASVSPKMVLHIRHRIDPPPKKKFALFRAYQPLVSEKIRPY